MSNLTGKQRKKCDSGVKLPKRISLKVNILRVYICQQDVLEAESSPTELELSQDQIFSPRREQQLGGCRHVYQQSADNHGIIFSRGWQLI